MRFYIMRHGPAEDRAVSGEDFDRALTASGRERVRDVARVLRDADEEPHAILSSPLVRALQTAEIVASGAKLADQAGPSGIVEARRELSPNGDGLGLVKSLVSAERKRVMLVGHEPDLADLVGQLLGRSVPGGLQKAMVVGLAAPSGLSFSLPLRLRFILDPKSLEWMEDAR